MSGAALVAAAAREAARRAPPGLARPDVLGHLRMAGFQQALDFILDSSPLKAACCTRRAAKSYSWGLEAIHDSWDYPRANYLFLGLVREEARRVFWKDVLKDAEVRYRVPIQFNESLLAATLPSGATIYVGGADANEQEMRKLLGVRYRKVAIDEAQDWLHTDLGSLVFETLKPATADTRGSISLLGVPGRALKGLFYDVARGAARGWSVHRWTTYDNPFMAKQWAEEIADLKARIPGIEDTPAFRRQYLGEWVVDENALVYRYRASRNDFDGRLPPLTTPWHNVLGVDLGYQDATAFVLLSWNQHSTVLHAREAWKKRGMDITDVANAVKDFQRRYAGQGGIDVVVVDGSNKQAVAEMQNRHGLALVPSDKTGKADFIELMNAEFTAGPRIVLDPARCRDLADEYGALVWDDKSTKRQEHPACENHACDAALYAWRYCYQYASRPPPERPREGSQEWAAEKAREMFERDRRRVERHKEAAEEMFGPVELAGAQPRREDWGGGFDLEDLG